jgi:hypothetical protein
VAARLRRMLRRRPRAFAKAPDLDRDPNCGYLCKISDQLFSRKLTAIRSRGTFVKFGSDICESPSGLDRDY